MRTSRLLVLAISLAVSATLLVGALRSQSPDQDSASPYSQIQVFTEVMEHISSDYVTEPDMARVSDGALHGLVESLDADSSYLNPDEYQAYLAAEKQPQPASIGAVVAKRLGYAAVVDVQAGGPAASAGLTRGDFIETVDDKSTRDLSLPQLNRALGGAAGTAVTLGVVHLHKTEPVKIKIDRQVLPAPPVTARLDGSAAVIAIPDFHTGRSAEVAKSLSSLLQQGATGIVLDLRNCGDGSFTEAEQTANLFLNKGTIDWLEGQKYPRVTSSADAAKAIAATQPLSVLVSAGTSGAAEVLAAAIADNGRGQTVGDHTFGDGALQKIIEVGDGSAVLISVARYYGPKGEVIEDGLAPAVQQVRYLGALPDEDFPPEGVNPATLQDLQMQKALALLKSNG